MNLQDIDFRDLSVGEVLDRLKAFKKPGLEPLVRAVAQAHSYLLASQNIREAVAYAEQNTERLAR